MHTERKDDKMEAMRKIKPVLQFLIGENISRKRNEERNIHMYKLVSYEKGHFFRRY